MRKMILLETLLLTVPAISGEASTTTETCRAGGGGQTAAVR